MVLAGEKRLLPKKDVQPVDAGCYPELSVKTLYAEYEERPEIKQYLPPKVNKGRICDKSYFWNVVNTVTAGEVEAMVDHANSQRNAVDSGDMNQESITMSQQMVELMQAHPWVSVSPFIALILIFYL
jgi:hypothetical protein